MRIIYEIIPNLFWEFKSLKDLIIHKICWTLGGIFGLAIFGFIAWLIVS